MSNGIPQGWMGGLDLAVQGAKWSSRAQPRHDVSRQGKLAQSTGGSWGRAPDSTFAKAAINAPPLISS